MSGYRRLLGRTGRSPRRADGRLRGIAPSVVGHGGNVQNHAPGGHRVSGGRGPEFSYRHLQPAWMLALLNSMPLPLGGGDGAAHGLSGLSVKPIRFQ